jgi:hypothetical protein
VNNPPTSVTEKHDGLSLPQIICPHGQTGAQPPPPPHVTKSTPGARLPELDMKFGQSTPGTPHFSSPSIGQSVSCDGW